MVYTTWKIERYPRDDTSWSSTAIEITDAYDPRLSMSYGDGKDTFEFKLQNFNGEWDNVWGVGDKVIVYYKVNSTTIESSDIVLLGIVVDVPNEHDADKNFIRISGNNFSETLMNALVFYSPPDSGDTVPEYIEQCLNSIGNFNQNYKVSWNGDNPSLKRDGVTAFPTIYEKWFYKSALKLLEQYSQDAYTQDGNYYWYVNTDNELVWRPKTDSIDYSFNASSEEYKALKVKKDLSNIANFIIAKGGNDPKNNPISTKVSDPVSQARNGFRYKLITYDASGDKNLIQQDYLFGSGGGFNPDNNIDSSNYPATTGWVSEITGTNISVASWNEYVDAFRLEMKYRLDKQAKDYLDAHKYGKLMIDLEFQPGKAWTIGNIVSVTIPEIGATNKKMRVKKAAITLKGELYTLEEDEGTVGAD